MEIRNKREFISFLSEIRNNPKLNELNLNKFNRRYKAIKFILNAGTHLSILCVPTIFIILVILAYIDGKYDYQIFNLIFWNTYLMFTWYYYVKYLIGSISYFYVVNIYLKYIFGQILNSMEIAVRYRKYKKYKFLTIYIII